MSSSSIGPNPYLPFSKPPVQPLPASVSLKDLAPTPQQIAIKIANKWIIGKCVENSRKMYEIEVARQLDLQAKGYDFDHQLVASYLSSYYTFKALELPSVLAHHAIEIGIKVTDDVVRVPHGITKNINDFAEKSYMSALKNHEEAVARGLEYDLDYMGQMAAGKALIDTVCKPINHLYEKVIPQTADYCQTLVNNTTDALKNFHKLNPFHAKKPCTEPLPLPKGANPPLKPHFYFYVGQHIQRNWKNLEKNELDQCSNLTSLIQSEYPNAKVLKEGRFDNWRYWLVENEGKHTVFFPGISKWASTQLRDGVRDQVALDPRNRKDDRALMAAASNLLQAGDTFNPLNLNPAEVRQMLKDKHPQLNVIQKQLTVWEKELNIKIDTHFGMSKGAYYGARTGDEKTSHISLNGQGVLEDHFNFCTDSDTLTPLSGTRQFCKSIGPGKHGFKEIAERFNPDVSFDDIYSGEYFKRIADKKTNANEPIDNVNRQTHFDGIDPVEMLKQCESGINDYVAGLLNPSITNDNNNASTQNSNNSEKSEAVNKNNSKTEIDHQENKSEIVQPNDKKAVEIDWGKITVNIASSIANSAAQYLMKRNEIDRLSTDVKSFIDGYQRKKKRQDKPIPQHDENILKEDMLNYFNSVISPALVKKSVRDLQESGKELSKTIQGFEKAKKELKSESEKINGDIHLLDLKAKKCQRALKKAISSFTKASKRSSIFSSILNTAATVMMAIPATQIAGASLSAATNLTSSFVDRNQSNIFNRRREKYQTKLQDILSIRQEQKDKLQQMQNKLFQIEDTDQQLTRWIQSEESINEICSKDRIDLLKEIDKTNNDNFEKAKESLKNHQSKISDLESTYNVCENELNTYRLPNQLVSRTDLTKDEKKTYAGLLAKQADRQKPLATLYGERTVLENDCQAKEKEFKNNSRLLIEAKARDPLRQKIEDITEEFRDDLDKKIIQLKREIAKPQPQNSSEDEIKQFLIEKEKKQKQLIDLELYRNHRNDLSEALSKFNAGLKEKYSPFINLMNASQDLARTVDTLTGTKLSGNITTLGMSALSIKMLLLQLQNAKGAWELFQQNGVSDNAGTNNLIFGVIIPSIKLASEVAALATFIRTVYRSYYPVVAEDPIERIKNSLLLHSNWMSEEFPKIIKSLETKMDLQAQMNTESNKEIMLNLNRIGHDLKNCFGEKIEQLSQGIEFKNYQNWMKDENELIVKVRNKTKTKNSALSIKTLPEFLNYITDQLENAKIDTRNGYLKTHDTNIERNRTAHNACDLRLVFQNPEHFTGLIGYVSNPLDNLPNWALYDVIAKEFIAACQFIKINNLGDINKEIKKQIIAVGEKLRIDGEKLLFLEESIVDTLESLIEEQIKLHGKVKKNIKDAALSKSVILKECQKFANENFKCLSEENILGNKRFFWNTQVLAPIKSWMPNYDYKDLANRITTQHKSAILDCTSQLAFDVELALLTYVFPPVMVFPAIFRIAKYIDHKPLGEKIMAETDRSLGKLLKDKNNNSIVLSSPIDTTQDAPSSYHETKMGIDVNKREIKIINKENQKDLYPFLTMKLSLIYNYYSANKESLNIEIDAKSPISKDEMCELDNISGTSIDAAKVITDYQNYLKGKTSDIFSKYEQSCQLISSEDPVNTISLMFPNTLLQRLEEMIQQELGNIEKTRTGTLIPFYEFKNNAIKIYYKYFSLNGENSFKLCSFTVAKFDPVTISSFQQEIVDSEGNRKRELANVNEFLLHAVYGSQLTMPGSKTKILKSGFVAPVDLKWPGCINIWNKKPSMINYNSALYTEKEANDLEEAVKGENEMTSGLLEEIEFPVFTVEYFQLHANVKERKEKMVSSKNYEKNYSILIAMIKLFSSIENKRLSEILEAKYGVYPTSQRTEFLDRHEIISTDGIDEFVDEIKKSPSEIMKQTKEYLEQFKAINDLYS